MTSYYTCMETTTINKTTTYNQAQIRKSSDVGQSHVIKWMAMSSSICMVIGNQIYILDVLWVTAKPNCAFCFT